MTDQARAQPVLMIPIRRCGSHAIRLRLAYDPRFYAPYPLHIIDFMPLVGLYGDLTHDEAYFQLIVDVIGLQNAAMVKWPGVALDPVHVFDGLAGRPRSIHAVTWEMLQQAAAQHGATVVMDKSLDSIGYAAEQLMAQPELRFVNVVRDPRAQVSSMGRAIIYDFDPLCNVLAWVRAHDMARALAGRLPDRVLTVRYEDLIHEPGPVLRRLCDFLGLSYHQSMVDVSSSAEAQEIAARSALWENNNKPFAPSFIDKYLRLLSHEEIQLIETVAADHMAHYGYEPITGGAAVITGERLDHAQDRSRTGRLNAWQQLRISDPRDYQLRQFRAWYLKALRSRLLGDQCPGPRHYTAPLTTDISPYG